MLNKTILDGRLARDPESRMTSDGKAVTIVTLANSDPWRKNDETLFFNATFFNKQAELVQKYCHKGDRIIASGRISQHTWKDKNGNNRRDYSIIADGVELMETKRDEDQGAPYNAVGTAPAPTKPTEHNLVQMKDEDLPF